MHAFSLMELHYHAGIVDKLYIVAFQLTSYVILQLGGVIC